jgi:hypothetical protein
MDGRREIKTKAAADDPHAVMLLVMIVDSVDRHRVIDAAVISLTLVGFVMWR